MSAKRTHDVVATVGTYRDRHDGNEKKRYQNCGSAFTNDDGNISIKLEALPLSKDWSGFLSLYPVKEREAPREQPPAGRYENAAAVAAGNVSAGDDDIPF